MSDPQMTIDDILAALEPVTGDYPREALTAAMAQPEALTPRLIDVLRQAAQNPDVAAESQLPFYAFFLLGHFRAAEAHQALLDLAALPCDKLEDILGDALTEHLPTVLYRTCGGQVEGLKTLALNPEACEYSVSAALQALSYAVVDGIFPRSEMMALLKSLLDPDRADELPEMAYTFAADAAYSLHPAELMDDIKAAYDADLIDEMVMDWDLMQERNEDDQDAAYKQLRQGMERYSLDDLHDVLPTWAMYNKQGSAAPPPAAAEGDQLAVSERPPKSYDKAKRKKKRKIAKASRKKNRGK